MNQTIYQLRYLFLKAALLSGVLFFTATSVSAAPIELAFTDRMFQLSIEELMDVEVSSVSKNLKLSVT